MSTYNHEVQSITAKAHQFALNAMREHTARGVLSQMMKSLATSDIDALGLSISEPRGERYLVASRGAIGSVAKDRIRSTLDALSGDEETGIMMPLIQAPCRLGLSEVRRIDETFECWYRQFSVGETRVTLVAFHKDQRVVDGQHRSLLVQMSRVVEATMVMLRQKEDARIALVSGPQILLEIQIDGLAEIRSDFGDFEGSEIIEGASELIRESIDAVSHVGCTQANTITVMLPRTADNLLAETKLKIGELIRLYPAPNGYQLDAYLRESQINGTAERANQTQHSVHIPTPPSEIASGNRSIAS